jgi:uncharacterized protein
MKALAVVISLALATCSRTPQELSPPSSSSKFASVAIASASVTTATSVATQANAPIVISPSLQGATAEAVADSSSKAQCPLDPDPASFRPQTVEASFETGPQLSIELVYRQDDTAHGLMYRRTMPETHGMLFKMKNEVHTFWMHNTCMSLDMLFLDETGVVLGILDRVPPLNDDRRSIGIASTYVLELVAGYASRHGITKGSKLEIPSGVKALKL